MRKIVRTKDAPDTCGLTRSQYFVQVRRGLLPRAFKLGERASGTFEDELELCKAARAAGRTEAEIVALVERIHAQRRVEVPA